MAPQLYLTMYKEHFRSPGRAKRAELRPTSAHRRNNPQPQPDFLFPRSLRSSYRPALTLLHPLPPVDTGRPLFPPVNHFLVHNPVSACPENPLGKTNSDSPQHMPPINDRGQKQQLRETPAASDGQVPSSLRTADYQRNINPVSARQLSDCYSCFHVVRPYQAAHYIIHPEFVSESLY